jgi:hypothetical protein
MKKRIAWMFAATLIALLMFSGAVFAEGEEPATVPAGEPAPAAVAEPAAAPAVEPEITPVEAPAAEPVVAPAVEPVVEVPAAVEQPVAEATVLERSPAAVAPLTEEATSSEVVAALAEADVVLVNAEGEPISMVSVEATEMLTLPDPYFYIGGVLYGYGSIMDAINDLVLMNKVPDGGIVYVEDGVFAENVIIDGTLNSILKNLKGLISENGSAFSAINGSVTLNGLLAGFTLQGFTITDGVTITNSKGALVLKDLNVTNPAGSGIQIGAQTGPDTYILHNGKVTLTDVESSGNADSGAEIFSTNGAVTITNAAFDNNGDYGLRMHVINGTSYASPISINYVSASFNGDDNVHISKYQTGLTIKNSVFNGSVNSSGLYAVSTTSGSATFNTVLANDNDEYGIRLETNGLVNLSNVDASGSVNNSGLYLWHARRTDQISISNSRFVDNGHSSLGNDVTDLDPYIVGYVYHIGSGLEIYSMGNILLSSITASGNENEGLYADSCLFVMGDCKGTGYVSVTSPLNGGFGAANHFDNNDKNGLEAYSYGTIYLNNFTADGNDLNGVKLISSKGSAALNTTLTNWKNTANGNLNEGIWITSNKDIWVNNTSADGNTWDGLFSESNSKYVQVTNGSFSGNGLSGVDITSMGSVVLGEIHADGNTLFGINIDNDAVDAGKTVTIKKTVANGNNAGIYVSTNGSTVFGRVNANSNTTYGAVVEGCLVEDCLYPATFTLYSTLENNFNGNGTFGLDVQTWGSISLENVNVQGNTSYGIHLDNAFSGLSSGVTMLNTKYQSIYDNGSDGLYILTNGAITLTEIISSSNNGYGAILDNTGASSLKTLTLTNCTFDGNEDGGLYANIKGTVLVYSLWASDNNVLAGGSGAYINNTGGTVTITSSTRGVSKFNYNDVYGLWINSTHAVTAKNLIADGNANGGAYITTNGNVAVSGTFAGQPSSFSGNGGSGLYVTSMGTITVSGYVQANGNLGGAGIDLYNQGSTSAKSILVSNTQTYGNATHGLAIYANGIVTLSNIESSWNADSGLYVENTSGLYTGNVTMTGANLFSNNGDYGLEIYTPKAASVNGVTSEYNGLSGIYIESALGTTYVLNSILRYNEGNGVEIFANNAVYLSGVKSLSNGIIMTSGSGLLVDTGGYNLTLKDSAFIGNFDYGIDAAIGAGLFAKSNIGYFGNNLGGGAGNLFIH